MADSLIETTATNPYENIVADTTNQLTDVQSQISKINSAIERLERLSPTSPTLPKLRERLSELKSKADSLTTTNDSAKSLLTAYNESLANTNTMEWIYQLKQAELNRAQEEADKRYNQMAEDVKRAWENYINALWNATASENAIINANAGREWASAQSTAETRARNYLTNAQAQAEQYGNMVTNLNAINDARLNSNAWYVQLSQSNADNTLRQQVMNDFEAQQSALNRAWSWTSSRWTSSIVDPYEQIIKAQWWGKWWGENKWTDEDWKWTTSSEAFTDTWWRTQATEDILFDPTKSDLEKYWARTSDVWRYHWWWTWAWVIDNWLFTETIADLNRNKTNDFLKKDSNWDIWSTDAWITTNAKWDQYVVFTDKNNRRAIAPLRDLQ